MKDTSDSKVSLDSTVHRFYNDLFPLVYRRLLNPGIGHMPPQSFSSPSVNHDDCLRMTRQDVSPFGPHPRLLVSSLSGALGAGRALSRLLRLAGEVVNATERATLSRECGRGLVRMQYCSHCRGLTLIRPCTGLCVNIMRGCLVSYCLFESFCFNSNTLQVISFLFNPYTNRNVKMPICGFTGSYESKFQNSQNVELFLKPSATSKVNYFTYILSVMFCSSKLFVSHSRFRIWSLAKVGLMLFFSCHMCAL